MSESAATCALYGMGVLGLGSTGVDIYRNASKGNWNNVMYDVGALGGSFAVGLLAGSGASGGGTPFKQPGEPAAPPLDPQCPPEAPSGVAGEAPSSRVLGENLEDAGISRPADSAAHHIVAGSDARAAEARAILQQEGIGINDAENGVFLPKNSSVPNPTGAQVHSTVHTNIYYNAVNSALRNAMPGTIADVLADIADQLLAGTFPS